MSYSRGTMEGAPQDGSRILIKTFTFGYDLRLGWRKTGDKWVECRWHGGKWSEWCGNPRTTSTSHIDAITWAPLPTEVS